ncbi:hypothetical protein BKA83DRAFT_4297889 [Pisolithus microcarpus]|nr:hypothetical protein BKA83DRAFT_4297889 [Pisolithus microcarpus]
MHGRSIHNTGDDAEDEDDSLVHMPDTTILFQRYLESGKMINVYDWFESFAVVLEEQRRHRQWTQFRNPARAQRKTPHTAYPAYPSDTLASRPWRKGASTDRAEQR